MAAEEQQQDKDVAVLRAELRHLGEQFNDLRVSMSSQLGALGGKFDVVTQLLRDTAVLQEAHAAHKDGITRAHGRIDEFEALIDRAIEDRDRWRTAHSQQHADELARVVDWRGKHGEEHGKIDRQISTWRGWLMGVGLLGGLCVALLGYILDAAVTKLDTVATQAQSTQVALLQHKLDEANEKLQATKRTTP